MKTGAVENLESSPQIHSRNALGTSAVEKPSFLGNHPQNASTAVENSGSVTQTHPQKASSAPRPGTDRIYLINEAIVLGKNVRFQYEKKDGTVTRRTVTPRELRRLSISELQALIGNDGVISKEGRLCMFGHCHLRGANRVFAIDRMQNLSLE